MAQKNETRVTQVKPDLPPNKPKKYNQINTGFGDTTYRQLLCTFLMYKKKQDIEKYQLL